MKVTATGVSEEAAMRMFELWRQDLEELQSGAPTIDVVFRIDPENART